MNKLVTKRILLIIGLMLCLAVSATPVAASDLPFSDVRSSAYYTEAVRWAYQHNVVEGTGKNTFSPDQTITRAQLVVILCRYAADPATVSSNAMKEAMPFADVRRNADGSLPYYYGPVAWARRNHITSGLSSTKFGVHEPCTRAQAITLFYNMMGRPESTTASPFLDVRRGAYYEKAVLWAYEKGVTSGVARYLFGSDEPVTRGQAVTWLYHLRDEAQAKKDRILTEDVADALPLTYKGKDYAAEFNYRYFFTHYPEAGRSFGSNPAGALSYYVETGRYLGQKAVENPPEGWRGRIVCIDPGHQDHGMSAREPNGPGSRVMKAKLTSGTEGSVTGIPEYRINLQIGLRLRDILAGKGYKVVMTRETDHVSLSNVDRAKIAEEARADIFIRLHCNGIDSRSAKGVFAIAPTSGNPYLSKNVIAESARLGSLLVDHQCASTGQRNQGVMYVDNMTGINWAKMPVTIVEMGYMSNASEDRFLASEDGQRRIAEGLADGVDAYFGK